MSEQRIPKFRAYIIAEKRMVDVRLIDYALEFIKEERNVYHYFSEIILEESTGLKDCKGVEIFEGDVVAIGEPQIKKRWECPVIMKDGCWSADKTFCKEESWRYPELKAYCNDVFQNCIEVIGNIHEVGK